MKLFLTVLVLLGLLGTSAPLMAESSKHEFKDGVHVFVDVDESTGGVTVYTPDDKTFAVGKDADVKINVDPNNQLSILYNTLEQIITIRNECSSNMVLKIEVLGSVVDIEPCKAKDILLSTAEEGSQLPQILEIQDTENPDEGREPISPIVA